MWVMMTLKGTKKDVYFECYRNREEAEMACRILNSTSSKWFFRIHE